MSLTLLFPCSTTCGFSSPFGSWTSFWSVLEEIFFCWLTPNVSCSASSLGMMSEDEKKMQRIEDIRELLS